MFHLLKLHQVLTVSIEGKPLSAFGKGRTKETIRKNSGAFCSSSQGLASGETVKPKPNLLGFYQSLTDLGEGNIHLQLALAAHVGKGNTKLQPTLAILSHLWFRGLRSTRVVYQQ